MRNQKRLFCFSGEIILNITIKYEFDSAVWQIIEDETTPGAVLLASARFIHRLYLNGSREDVVRNPDKVG